jgi:hypothetical protein
MTLAIGDLFSPSNKSHQIQQGSADKTRGLVEPMTHFEISLHAKSHERAKYFRAAEALLDPMDYNDMHCLQAVVCVAIYLQAAALMHSRYSYILTAIASSLKMGLHQSTKSSLLDPIQQETRRRVWLGLRTVEIYVTTLLGMPLIIDDHDIDQPLPYEIEDKSITIIGIMST